MRTIQGGDVAGDIDNAADLAMQLSRMLEQGIASLHGESGLLAVREHGGSFRVGASKNLSEKALSQLLPFLDEVAPRVAQSHAFDVLADLAGHPTETLANGGGHLRYIML